MTRWNKFSFLRSYLSSHQFMWFYVIFPTLIICIEILIQNSCLPVSFFNTECFHKTARFNDGKICERGTPVNPNSRCVRKISHRIRYLIFRFVSRELTRMTTKFCNSQKQRHLPIGLFLFNRRWHIWKCMFSIFTTTVREREGENHDRSHPMLMVCRATIKLRFLCGVVR